MRLRSCLLMFVLACCAISQAADKPAAQTGICANPANTAAQSKQCQEAAAPVFIVPVETAAQQAAKAAKAKADDAPYNGLFQRSPLFKYLAWYCAIMAPVALIFLNVFTLTEYRIRREKKRKSLDN
jgi:hypothetical protein